MNDEWGDGARKGAMAQFGLLKCEATKILQVSIIADG